MTKTSPWDIAYLIVVLVGIIALAYFASKWLAKRYTGQGQAAKHLKVIDKMILGQDRVLYIVKTGEKAMLLGVTQHHIEKICDIPIEDLPQEQNTGGVSFTDTLKSTLKNNWGVHLGGKSGGSDKEEKSDLDNK